MLSEKAKEYIKENQKLIEEDKFQEFFNKCHKSSRCEIAEFFLLDCEIDFLEYMIEIPSELFYDSTRLENISIPNSITTIGNLAFWNCESLQSINIPNSVTAIGYSAFYKCKSLQSIFIPDSVTNIGSYVFEDCTSLKEIKLPKNIKDMILYLSSIGIDEDQTNVIWY